MPECSTTETKWKGWPQATWSGSDKKSEGTTEQKQEWPTVQEGRQQWKSGGWKTTAAQKTHKSSGSWGGARDQWLQAADARNLEAALKASRESWHSAGVYHDRDATGSAAGAMASHRHEPVMTATAKATKRSREASANANRPEPEEDEITLKVCDKTITISETVRGRVMAAAVSRVSRAQEDEEEAKAEKARRIEAEAKRTEEARKAKAKSDEDAVEADRLQKAEDDVRKEKEKAKRSCQS